MAITLLTNTASVKRLTDIDSNMEDKYMVVAIREAQDIDLCAVLGDNLVERLVALVENGTLSTHTKYKVLVDKYVSVFLAYATASRLVPMATIKVANAGAVKATDERITTADSSERSLKAQGYVNARDAYCSKMQRYILANINDFPEVSTATAYQMKANLHSSANPGIWLGGRRGKIVF